MCGLVAAITKTKNGFNQFDLEAFKQMLFADTLRGKDSTGVFAINNIGNVGIAKDSGSADKFIESDEYKELDKELYKDGWAVVGHNRKATRGEINDTNSHPFWVEDKLVLVHNGSYNGSHKHLADVEVDSNAIAIHMSKHINDYDQALQKVNAAYALIFYDIENKKLQFIRNKERPLWMVETASAIFFSSEPGLLQWILHRNDLKYTGKIVPLEEHVLYTWELRGEDGYDEYSKKLDCSFRYTQSSSSSYTWGRGSDWEQDDSCGYEAWARQNYSHKPQHISHLVSRSAANRDDQDPVGTPVLQAPETSRETEFNLLRDLCVPNSAHPHYKHREWIELKKVYPNEAKLTVVINDWIQPTTKFNKYYLTGSTLDKHSVPVIFGVDGNELHNIMESINDDGLLFEIEIDTAIWKRNNGSTAPKSVTDLDELDGVAFILGSKHQLIRQGTTSGQTH